MGLRASQLAGEGRGYANRASKVTSVTTSSTSLAVTSPLGRRAEVQVTSDPDTTDRVYIAVGRTATTADWDYYLDAGDTVSIPADENIAINAIADPSASNVYIIEWGP